MGTMQSTSVSNGNSTPPRSAFGFVTRRLSQSPARRTPPTTSPTTAGPPRAQSAFALGSDAGILGPQLAGAPVGAHHQQAGTSGNNNNNNLALGEEHDSSVSGGSDDNGGGSSDKAALWCYVKAKTRLHDSTKVVRRTLWFEAKEGATARIGSAEECELRLEDDRCAALNARLLGIMGDTKVVTLHPEARIYRLVGMGLKRGSISAPLQLGSVIKLGSVSLEVTAMCTERSESLFERFGTEIKASANRHTQAKSTSVERKMSKKPRKGAESLEQSAKEEGKRDGSGDVRATDSGASEVQQLKSQMGKMDLDGDGEDLPSDKEEDEDDVIGEGQPLHLLPEVTDPRDEMCYICWGGPSEEDLQGDLKNPNPLIRNPCGKCSGSSRYVHLECILRWIKTNGSGHCSVCNGALPPHFSSPPPNLELKVIRHRRGQSWAGTRRFRVSFAEREHAIIGRDHDCMVKLPDRSVCGTHARIVFDKTTRTFMLQDCASVSGTFLQVNGDMGLESGSTNYIKIGRTILSFRVSERRKSLRDFLPRISRALSR